MKTLAIIAEYNPFHNGHQYHLECAKKLTGADYSIALMSGNFLQRGIPAMWDKYTRATMASLSGVDLTLELPFVYAS
ncbi:MAG: nucleotidyltransferase family protein, partial [Lachnospiraceae bacterium]|nr:nucleotidyltransferase family protein [Lachnospiraceae bacterium]